MQHDLHVGSYVRVVSIPEGAYGDGVEELRRRSIGKICRISEISETISVDGIQTAFGECLVSYVDISTDGIQSISFYVFPENIVKIIATEEMLLLYSPDIWQLINPFGMQQETETFKKLYNLFG